MIQVKDIDKIAVLKRLAEIESSGHSGTWFSNVDNSISTVMPEGAQEKVALAVMKNLISKGLVSGCGCGCRGDFTITDKGRDLIAASPQQEAE